jgi:hypothetical protein
VQAAINYVAFTRHIHCWNNARLSTALALSLVSTIVAAPVLMEIS